MIFFINCGGGLDLTQKWFSVGKNEDIIKLFLLDNHKPIHHANIESKHVDTLLFRSKLLMMGIVISIDARHIKILFGLRSWRSRSNVLKKTIISWENNKESNSKLQILVGTCQRQKRRKPQRQLNLRVRIMRMTITI